MVTCGHWDLGHGHENLQFSGFLKWGTHLSSSKIIQNPLLSIKNEWLGLPIVLEATMWTWSLHWNVLNLNLCELGKLGWTTIHQLRSWSVYCWSVFMVSPHHQPGNTLWNWDSPCCKISGGFALQKKNGTKKVQDSNTCPYYKHLPRNPGLVYTVWIHFGFRHQLLRVALCCVSMWYWGWEPTNQPINQPTNHNNNDTTLVESPIFSISSKNPRLYNGRSRHATHGATVAQEPHSVLIFQGDFRRCGNGEIDQISSQS